MCWKCKPGGFKRRACDICGIGSRAHVVVCMGTGATGDHPFTETALCKGCFDKLGFRPALEHNADIRELAGTGASVMSA